VQLSLRLLSIHLSMALARGVTSAALAVVGTQASPLRNLLFRLLDTNLPLTIQQVPAYCFSLWVASGQLSLASLRGR